MKPAYEVGQIVTAPGHGLHDQILYRIYECEPRGPRSVAGGGFWYWCRVLNANVGIRIVLTAEEIGLPHPLVQLAACADG